MFNVIIMATLKGAVNQYFDLLRWKIKLTMHAVVWGVAGQSMDSSNRELHESQTKVMILNFAMGILEATCSCAHSIHIPTGTQAQLCYRLIVQLLFTMHVHGLYFNVYTHQQVCVVESLWGRALKRNDL